MQVSSFAFIEEGGERNRRDVNESTSQRGDEAGGYGQETPRFRVLRPFLCPDAQVRVCVYFPTQGLYVSVEDYTLKLCLRG